MEPTSTLEIPKLSDSDLQWLHERIGIKNLRDNEWKSEDYVLAIEEHLDKNPECRLSVANQYGNTPLHLVAISGNYAAIDALLMCGADVNEINNDGNTPITYSHHCPDYNVGFQFFRHLHKLAFLGQHIDKINSIWKYDVGQTYKQRYPRNGFLTAFMHNPSLTGEAICKIRDGGENVVIEMYEKELRKIQNTRVRKTRVLGKIANVTDRLDVAENHLKDLRKFTKCSTFHKTFPLFGFMIKYKYRQTIEHIRTRELGELDESYESMNHKSVNWRASDTRQVAGTDNSKRLKKEAEQRMKEFKAPEYAALVGRMNDLMMNKNKNQQTAAQDFSSLDSSMHGKVQVDNFDGEQNKFELSNDQKVERLRKFMAKLPRSG